MPDPHHERPRERRWAGPFVMSQAARQYAVIGPWGVVADRLGRWQAGDLAARMNQAWEDGYQAGLCDVQLLIDPAFDGAAALARVTADYARRPTVRRAKRRTP